MSQRAEVQDSSDKITKSNLGKWLETGGPGRPVGSKNKFTQVKEALVEAFLEIDGKEKFINTLKNGDKINLKALNAVLAVLPKDPLIDASQHNTQIKYEWNANSQHRLQSPELSARDTRESEEVSGGQDRTAGWEDGTRPERID